MEAVIEKIVSWVCEPLVAIAAALKVVVESMVETIVGYLWEPTVARLSHLISLLCCVVIMEVVRGPVVEKIVSCLWALIARQFNHLKSLRENVESLRGKMERLSAQESDVKEKLNTGMVILAKQANNAVQLWLKNVEEVSKEEKIIQKEFAENKKCLKGCLPNYYMRIKLSKLAVEKIQVVEDLQDDSEDWKDYFSDPKPNIGLEIPTTTLVGKTTAEKTLERVWESLMDSAKGIIGVYGMGGVGKTTIMKHINNKLLKEGNLFDEIIWVTVSKNLNMEEIQKNIATILNLDISGLGDETTRAAKLSKTLKRGKFVLILDDVWREFSLEIVGIPPPSRENGCKLILTTRSLNVCVRMNCQQSIKVKSLSEGEAWELFKQNVGNDIKLAPKVEQIALLVARECSCLPLAIVTVGQAMKQNNDVKDWRNALRELKSSIANNMNDEVFGQLKFSYEHLSNDKVKECFLYCALYPEDHYIRRKELIEYWISEGLIDDFKDREAEMDKGHVVLKELTNSCMLENVGGKCVKMHDLIRDMAIDITSKSNRFIVKAGVRLQKSLDREEWIETVERISLMNNKIEALPDQPKCLKLSTLLLQKNPLRQNIPNSFFEQMHYLRVLDLSNTLIAHLPESLSNLENLHALLLQDCRKLKRVPSLSKLSELRVLNLKGTGIKALPQGMEGAVNLRHINLNNTRDLQLFPVGVLPNLPLLKDLLMRDCRWKWTVSTLVKAKGGADVGDIISLRWLGSLEIHLENSQGWISYMRSMKWQSLTSFYFIVGNIQLKREKKNFCVKILGCNLVCQESSLVFPDQTQYLYMENCIIQSSELLNLKDLKELYMMGCEGIEECINIKEVNTLSNLKNLHLSSMPSLRTVCNGVVPSGTLKCLKILIIIDCNEMKNALPLGLFQQLRNLEKIEVYDCSQIEIIAVEAWEEEKEDEINTISPTTTIALPSLKELKLRGLPKLKRICRGVLTCNSLQTVVVDSCPELKLHLFASHLKLFNLGCLEYINVCYCEKMEVIVITGEEKGDTSNNSITLPNLKQLQLSHLPELERIFESEIAFEEIKVVDSEQNEEITEGEAKEGKNEEITSTTTTTTVTLPSLKKFDLSCLPKLDRICKGSLICNSLQTINVFHCEKLKKILLSAPQLKFLEVTVCNSLKNLWPLGLWYNLQYLKEIWVGFCEKIEVIVVEGEEEEEVAEESNNTITLPNLKQLRLEDLPKLKRICKSKLVCESLCSIKVQKCPLLKKLPFSVDNLLPSLEKIEGSKKWWDALEWDDPKTKIFLHPFFKVLEEEEEEEEEEKQEVKEDGEDKGGGGGGDVMTREEDEEKERRRLRKRKRKEGDTDKTDWI